jgi:hypothetical protein
VQIVIARCNLAGWRAEAGDAAGVEAAFAELAPVLERWLSPDPPHTFSTPYGDIIIRELEPGDTAGPTVTTARDLLSLDLHVETRGPVTVYEVAGDVVFGGMEARDPSVDESTD